MTISQAQQLQPQPRLLAIDPGSARIGIAVSDALGLYAHPRPAVSGKSLEDAVRAISKIVQSEEVSEVFVGLALTLRGEAGAQANEARPLVAALRAALGVPVREIDERMSSAQASSQAPKLTNKRDGSLDSASAAVILQSVLDSRRRAASR